MNTKRYIRIDLEYESDNTATHSNIVVNNIKKLIHEDMPYIKVLFIRNAPTRDILDDLTVTKS